MCIGIGVKKQGKLGFPLFSSAYMCGTGGRDGRQPQDKYNIFQYVNLHPQPEKSRAMSCASDVSKHQVRVASKGTSACAPTQSLFTDKGEEVPPSSKMLFVRLTAFAIRQMLKPGHALTHRPPRFPQLSRYARNDLEDCLDGQRPQALPPNLGLGLASYFAIRFQKDATPMQFTLLRKCLNHIT